MPVVELAPEEVAARKPYLDWGLTEEEYQRLADKLGRLPNFTEVGLASGMWSEHCAYKYSKPILKQFWTHNDRVLMGPGEGAGVIDIGEGKAVVFKPKATTTRVPLSHTKGPRPGSVVSSATSFPSGQNPLRYWIRSALVNWTTRTSGTSLIAWSPELVVTATPSGFLPLAGKPTSMRPTRRIRS